MVDREEGEERRLYLIGLCHVLAVVVDFDLVAVLDSLEFDPATVLAIVVVVVVQDLRHDGVLEARVD